MPPLRPPSESGSGSNSGSESDAPETVSLSQSKRSVKQQDAEIRKVGALTRQKTKLKNREKDQKLKERAASNKKVPKKAKAKERQVAEGENGDGDDDGRSVDEGVEVRMLRAMRDAEKETDERKESDLKDDEGFQEDSSFGSADMDEDGDDAEGFNGHDFGTDEDDDMESGDTDSDDNAAHATNLERPQSAVNYLPDEIFKAAFSQTAKPKLEPSQSKKKGALSTKRQKKRLKRSEPKDVVVGSKAIRTLASKTRPISASAAVPSSKVNKFLNRTLALTGHRPVPGKAWERRPVNVGVLRKSGPPAHFVRKP